MIGTIVGIIGAILTLLFGIYSIKISRRENKQHQLSFSKVQCLSLFDSIVENIDGIEVNYKQSPINKSIILFEARIENKGFKDVDSSGIHSPLRIIIGQNFNFLECKVSDISENINASAIIVGINEIEVKWDLLKKNEFIQFTTLIKEVGTKTQQVEENDEKKIRLSELFYDTIKFDFRITNIDKIFKASFEPQKEQQKRANVNRRWIMGGIVCLLGLFTMIYGFYKPIISGDLVGFRLLDKSDNTQKEYDISTFLDENGQMKLSSYDKEFEESMLIDDFSKNYEIVGVSKHENKSHVLKYMFSIFGLIYFLFGCYFLYSNYRKYKEIKTTPNRVDGPGHD